MPHFQPSEPFRRAVVLGASVAGLLAARALSELFDEVVIVERDQRPATGFPRRGVPQAQQSHLLLRSGLRVIEQLFPGFLADLDAAGFETYDLAADVSWWHRSAWKARFESGVRAYAIGRTDLEDRLRRRVLDVPNVQVLWDRAVAALDLDESGRRVVGVTLDDLRGEVGRVAADLVVDATGAGTELPRLLAEQGLTPAPEERVALGLSCTTGVFELPAAPSRDWRALFVPPSSRRVPRGGVILPLGGHRYSVSLYGYQGDRAGTSEAGFRNFAATLSHPSFGRALQGARLVSRLLRFSVPVQLRRRYDLGRLPEGLVAVGDALCRVDPVFAQGMSLAALEVARLSRLLRRRRRRRDPIRGLSQAYHRAAVRASEAPWTMGGGLARGASGGGAYRRGLGEAYWRAALRAGTTDRRLHAAFLRVWHLERSPASLFAPWLAARVLLATVLDRVARQGRARGGARREAAPPFPFGRDFPGAVATRSSSSTSSSARTLAAGGPQAGARALRLGVCDEARTRGASVA